jgi:hypothetical protein
MKTETKPCKVCGGKACICQDGERAWAAHCMDCDQATGKKGFYSPIHQSQKEAIKEWNKLNEGR